MQRHIYRTQRPHSIASPEETVSPHGHKNTKLLSDQVSTCRQTQHEHSTRLTCFMNLEEVNTSSENMCTQLPTNLKSMLKHRHRERGVTGRERVE